MTITLKVNNKDDWFSLLAELRHAEVLRREDVFLPTEFPVEIPVDISKLFELLNNPMVKPFKKKIGTTLQNNLLKVKGAVC